MSTSGPSRSGKEQRSQNKRQQRQNGSSARSKADNGPTSKRQSRHDSGFTLSVPGYAQSNAPSLLETLVDSDIPSEVQRLVEAELNRDHILANLNEAETTWRRYTLLNNFEMVLASHPPKQSIWQGREMRQSAGLDDGRTALTSEQVHQLRDAFDAAYERTTRSRGGWQQRLLSRQQEERRIIEEREQESQNRGWLSKLLG